MNRRLKRSTASEGTLESGQHVDHWNGWGLLPKRVTEIYEFNIPSGSDDGDRCGSGNLLADSDRS